MVDWLLDWLMAYLLEGWLIYLLESWLSIDSRIDCVFKRVSIDSVFISGLIDWVFMEGSINSLFIGGFIDWLMVWELIGRVFIVRLIESVFIGGLVDKVFRWNGVNFFLETANRSSVKIIYLVPIKFLMWTVYVYTIVVFSNYVHYILNNKTFKIQNFSRLYIITSPATFYNKWLKEGKSCHWFSCLT